MSKVIVGCVGVGLVVVAGWYLTSMTGDNSPAITANTDSAENAVMEKDVATEQVAIDEKKMMDAKTMEDDKMIKKDDMMKPEETMMDDGDMPKDEVSAVGQAGTYGVYDESKLAMAATGDVVLFFKASWCPSCRAVDGDIKANLLAIPSTLTILEVDYDTSAALKTKYGVTTQHTFVQVDQNGTLLKKWSGGATLASVVAEVL